MKRKLKKRYAKKLSSKEFKKYFRIAKLFRNLRYKNSLVFIYLNGRWKLWPLGVPKDYPLSNNKLIGFHHRIGALSLLERKPRQAH